ncbi:DUF6302 family protein [Streptomyces sp. NPDC056672]|uniref:DUF6302 family protein n=1 Tax=Streptomyces sp. NPDC056672 TaxID=3345906 RepID=UPI0036AFAC8F
MIPTLDGPLLYPPLRVRLRPPHEACDYEHVCGRLADRRPATVSVAIQVRRVPLLSVPVDGRDVPAPLPRRHLRVTPSGIAKVSGKSPLTAIGLANIAAQDLRVGMLCWYANPDKPPNLLHRPVIVRKFKDPRAAQAVGHSTVSSRLDWRRA